MGSIYVEKNGLKLPGRSGVSSDDLPITWSAKVLTVSGGLEGLDSLLLAGAACDGAAGVIVQQTVLLWLMCWSNQSRNHHIFCRFTERSDGNGEIMIG